MVASNNGPLQQVALTYRGAPLDGADKWLIGTMEHSVLGHRFIYDAMGDPVYIAALATTIQTGGHEAELIVDTDGVRVRRAPTALVSGMSVSGTPRTGSLVAGGGADATTAPLSPSPIELISTSHEHGVTYIDAGDLHLAVSRVLPASAPDMLITGSSATGSPVTGMLQGTWAGLSEPLALAWLLG